MTGQQVRMATILLHFTISRALKRSVNANNFIGKISKYDRGKYLRSRSVKLGSYNILELSLLVTGSFTLRRSSNKCHSAPRSFLSIFNIFLWSFLKRSVETIRFHQKNVLFNIGSMRSSLWYSRIVSDSFEFSTIRKRVWSGCRRCLFVS